MRHIICCLLAMLVVVPANGQVADTKQKDINYKGIVEIGAGIAYNLNTAQTVSTNNMQMLWAVSTSQGIAWNGLFGGIGIGYNHSQRDKENMYLTYADVRYTFEKYKLASAIGIKGGIIYDPYWIEKVNPYGALCVNVDVYKGFCVGLEGSMFARPNRHFTANASVVVSYSFGK